jgi:surface antigen
VPEVPPIGSPEPSGITTSSITPEPIAALPPPEPDPANPHEKRALAAGLHPRISSVVLASLTDADYRNATTAIDKALAETADADKFVWPRERSDLLAVFQVHFVPGTSEKCRRYVVTVVKNGWTTTAPPMEKCGIATPQRTDGHARKSARSHEHQSQPITPVSTDHAPTDSDRPAARSPI